MRKGIIVDVDENAERFGWWIGSIKAAILKTNTYGAKSCIAEGIAAGGGQGEDEGNDGGTNHVWVLFGVCGLEL